MHHFLAGPEDAAGNLTSEAAKICPDRILRPDHCLHREARVDVVSVVAHVNCFQSVEQRRALIPRHGVGFFHDVVALQCRDGDELDIRCVEPFGVFHELLAHAIEGLPLEINEIHLVHADDEVLDAEQGGDERVAAGLLRDALAHIDDEQCELG